MRAALAAFSDAEAPPPHGLAIAWIGSLLLAGLFSVVLLGLPVILLSLTLPLKGYEQFIEKHKEERNYHPALSASVREGKRSLLMMFGAAAVFFATNAML
jgi:hypothetical protein